MADAAEWFTGAVGEANSFWARAKEAPTPIEGWNCHGSPTYQRNKPSNENATNTAHCGNQQE